MRSITIRKIPDATYRTLKVLAIARDIPLGIYMLQVVEAHAHDCAETTNAALTASTHEATLRTEPSTDSPVTDTPEQDRKG